MGWRRWCADPRDGETSASTPGHEVVGINADQPDCRGFDLVHIFNCRVEGSFHQQMASCKAAGVPVVVSPIWISLARAIWGSRGSTGVLTQAVQQGEAAAAPLLEQMRKREMVVQLQHGPVNAEGNGDYCWPLNRGDASTSARGRWFATTAIWNYRPYEVICNGMATASKSPTTA